MRLRSEIGESSHFITFRFEKNEYRVRCVANSPTKCFRHHLGLQRLLRWVELLTGAWRYRRRIHHRSGMLRAPDSSWTASQIVDQRS